MLQTLDSWPQRGAYRAAVLAHKASVRESMNPAERQRSASAMPRTASGLHALHEGDEGEDDGEDAHESAYDSLV